MSVQHNNPGMALKVGVALLERRLVKYDGTYCGLDTTKDWVGVTQEPRTTVGDYVPIRFLGAGTCILTASAAITAGSVVYKAANGQVSSTSTGSTRVGIALEAASGAGVQLEVLND